MNRPAYRGFGTSGRGNLTGKSPHAPLFKGGDRMSSVAVLPRNTACAGGAPMGMNVCKVFARK